MRPVVEQIRRYQGRNGEGRGRQYHRVVHGVIEGQVVLVGEAPRIASTDLQVIATPISVDFEERFARPARSTPQVQVEVLVAIRIAYHCERAFQQ